MQNMLLKVSAIGLIFILTVINTEEVNNALPEPETIEKQSLTEKSKKPELFSYISNGVSSLFTSNTTSVNITSDSNDETNSTQKYVKCLPNLGSQEVQLVNDTELIKLLLPDQNVTHKDKPGNCILVLFYSKHCPFSSMAAPHYNALPRAFPDIKMVAINAMMYHLFNTQNGIVGVPSLLLFHNGRAAAKYNDSKYSLDLFSKFITRSTGIQAIAKKTFVSSADFGGPVYSVPSKESDTFLVLSWIFLYLCAGYYFTMTDTWSWIVETAKKYWRESEAHAEHEQDHEHVD